MDEIEEFLQTCDNERPRIRQAYNVISRKISQADLKKLNQLNDFESFFITYYIGQGISWLNDDLRNGINLITKCKYLFAKFFDDSLEKIPSYDGIVYRMDNPNADADFELAWFAKNIGKNILLRHYLSTSIERWDNRPITWEIRTLKNGSFGKDIIELNTTEKEVLFKRNSKFTIIKY